MRKIIIEPDALEDMGWWIKNNPKIMVKIYEIISNTIRTPFAGLGKPEPLKSDFSGYWSRRITDEHRLIYKIEPDSIVIISLKGHYSKK